MPNKRVQEMLQELIDKADDIFANIMTRKESISLYEEALKKSQRSAEKTGDRIHTR